MEDKEQLRKQNEGQRQMTRKKEAEIDILKAELTKAHHKIMKLKRTQEGHLIKMRDQYNTTLEQIRQKIKKYKKKSKHCCDNVLDICHKPIELPYVAEPTLNSVRSMEDLMKNGIQSRSSLIDEV